jgi:hypothetical protein
MDFLKNLFNQKGGGDINTTADVLATLTDVVPTAIASYPNTTVIYSTPIKHVLPAFYNTPLYVAPHYPLGSLYNNTVYYDYDDDSDYEPRSSRRSSRRGSRKGSRKGSRRGSRK